jgi:hypothetical protein
LFTIKIIRVAVHCSRNFQPPFAQAALTGRLVFLPSVELIKIFVCEPSMKKEAPQDYITTFIVFTLALIGIFGAIIVYTLS